MLPLVIFALGAPAPFVAAVDKAVAANKAQLADWWEDDLDGDGKNENIALMCVDHDHGVLLVQTPSGALLQAPASYVGKNGCPQATGKPAWHVEKKGKIEIITNVHHGQDFYDIAIRNHRLVNVGTHGFEQDVRRPEDDSGGEVNFDKLTWENSSGNKTTRGSIVVAGGSAPRKTALTAATLSATGSGSHYTVHVHADRPVVVLPCEPGPDAKCKPIKLGKGDTDVPVNDSELTLTVGGTTVHVKIFDGDGDAGYPKA
jgi:hypothetical protein